MSKFRAGQIVICIDPVDPRPNRRGNGGEGSIPIV